MPPGGVTKKVQVKLTSCHIPLKRKYILIKEGRQLLMLKALGDSRCVYSIEERGIARRGITRSGKRHFQFSLPKFVNALGGMNNHNQHPNDHVTSKFSHPNTEASQAVYKSRKGHFARKSTGNNIKRAIHISKKEAGKQQLTSQDAQNSSKLVKFHSKTDANPLDLAQGNVKSSSPDENQKNFNDKVFGDDQKDLKGPTVSTRSSKQKQTLLDSGPWRKVELQKEQWEDHHRGIECLQSPPEKKATSGEQSPHHTKEKSVIVKSVELEDKENVEDCDNFSNDEKNSSSNRSPPNSSSKPKTGQQLGKKESLIVTESDKTVSVGSKQWKEASLEKPPDKMLDAKLENVTPNLQLQLQLYPTQLSETVKKRERASTPTPESPMRKSIVNKLSRKRHRSASPKVCSSKVESSSNLPVKPLKEPIKLHTKKYEKVKNACKNAISQRKDKTVNKLDVENAENVRLEAACGKTSFNSSEHSVPGQTGTPSVEGKELLSDRHEPVVKKAKLSLPGDEKLNVSQREAVKVRQDTSKTGNHPQADSDDGLARLMKDFQSAIVASTTQNNSNIDAPKLRYISKKTSQHSVVAKQQKLPLSAPRGRREESKQSISLNVQILKPIPTEAVSSDEEFECVSDVDTQTSASTVVSSTNAADLENDDQSLRKSKQCSSTARPTVKIPESITLPTASPTKFMVVDEIGYRTTEDDSNNSSQSTCKVSESQQTASPSTPNHINLPYVKVGKEQLPEPGVTLREDQTYSPSTDNVKGLHNSAIDSSNCTLSGKEAFKNGLNCGSLEDGEASEDSLQDVGKRNGSEESSLKRESESDTRGSDRKKLKMVHKPLDSHYTQTDERVISMKDKAVATEVWGKRDVKNQATQFDGGSKDIDTEEISRIVAAMYESECEEKERLVKALQVQKDRENKWRTIAENYARQLQELKSQLESKMEKETTEKGVNTSEENSSTALPVIISCQSTQTERIQTKAMPVVIPVEKKTAASSPAEPSKPSLPPSEGRQDLPKNILPSVLSTDKVESVIPIATSTVITSERKLPTGPSTASRLPSENLKPTNPLPNGSKNQLTAKSLPSGSTKNDSSPAKSLPQNNGIKSAISDKNIKADTSKDVTIIDLTDTEDVSTGESSTSSQTNKMSMQSRSSTQGKMTQGSPVSLRKSPGISSKPNILQLTTEAGTKEHSVENRVIALTSPSVLPCPPVSTKSDSNAAIPTRSQPSSSVQGIQRVVQTKPVQNSGTMKVPTNLPVNQLVTIGQMPLPRLQAAPAIAGSIYSPQSSQVPVFSTISNIGMIIGNQPQPRQNSGVPGMLQAQRPLQRGISPQNLADILGPKLNLEKKQRELQHQLTHYYQRNNSKKVNEVSVQLQAVVAELRNVNERLNMSAQGQRNIRIAQVSASQNVTTQASRLPLAPPYNIATGSGPPASTVHQLNQAVQQREVNGVKPHVPLATLNTATNNSTNKSPGTTWFPETRQGADVIDKQGKGNKFIQHLNQPARAHEHPAKLPILQQPPIQNGNPLLPPPSIRITHSPEGVVLSWNINVREDHPTVKKYFLYAYQVLNTPPSTSHWKRIGEVGALAPPMACTLNQFQPGSTYFLAICAVDVYDRPGTFSKTEEVVIPT